MILKPIFPFLKQGQVRSRNIEYYADSKKAFTMADLYNVEKKEPTDVGFLFHNTGKISQKAKNVFTENQLGVKFDTIDMLHFIYSIDNEKELRTYILDLGDNIVIIEAEKVELIEEGVYFV